MLVEIQTVKGHLDEASEMRNWRKGNPCYRLVNNLAELCLCPVVLWQVELMINEIEYLVEAISKQSVKGAA